MIQFVKSPVGQYYLAYAIGDTASFKGELEKELIEKGYAIEVPEETNQSNAGRLQPVDSKPGGSEAIPTGDNGGDRSGRGNHKPNPRSRSRN